MHAERIGEEAERGLARIDPVTAIQFASVYRRLADLDELEAVVRKLRDEPDPRGRCSSPSKQVVPSDVAGRVPSPVEPSEGAANVTRRGNVDQP